MFASDPLIASADAVVVLLVGVVATLCGFRFFSKKPDVTPLKRWIFASYWVIGVPLTGLGLYLLATGKSLR